MLHFLEQTHMWFKNLQIYRLTGSFKYTPEVLHDRLLERAARACGSLETSTIGWDQPLGRHGSQLTHATGGCIMICARREERLVPSSVVREQLEEKVADLEEREGRRAGRREKGEIKDEIIQDLLPRAFIKSTRVYAYIDTRNDWLLVDEASAKRAEELITLLRETLGTLPLRPLEVEEAPASVMTAWLQGKLPPEEFQPLEECELRDPSEERAVVRCSHQDLQSEEIQVHIKAGKQVVKIALEWHERLSLLLTDEFAIKRLRFLEVIQEEAAEVSADDAAARFDADFALMSLELGRFLPRLIGQFGGELKRE
jgi:recombination associated protein RdgC